MAMLQSHTRGLRYLGQGFFVGVSGPGASVSSGRFEALLDTNLVVEPCKSIRSDDAADMAGCRPGGLLFCVLRNYVCIFQAGAGVVENHGVIRLKEAAG